MNPLSRPAESLLEHAEFLRRLAVQLAGTGGAEDLQQETWVASLAHPPQHGDNVRGWLRTVAGNLWRNQRRSAVRRAARERESGLRHDVPGVDEIAAREEVRRRVVAAVLALPEPLRQVVLLRFYEGLDSPAIGARLQRPASTVRTQLQTALERLRQRLDGEHGGERARWAAPLLAWQRFLQPPAVASAGAVAWVVRAALLLVAVGTTLWWLQTPEPDVPLSTTAAMAARDAAMPPAAWNANERVAAAPPPSVAVAAPPAHTAARPLGALRGRVLDADTGEALAAVRVRLRAVGEVTTGVAGLPDERRVDAARHSGQDGEFAFGELSAGLYELVAEHEGDRSARARVAVGGAPALVDLHLEAQPFRGAAVVKVLTNDGRAVPGAAVAIAATCTQRGPIGHDGVPPIEGTTDARGLFRFRDPERLEHMFEGVAVATTDDGRVGSAVIGRPEHRGYKPWIEVIVDRPATIEGRLQGPRADWTGTSVAAQLAWTYGSVHEDLRVGETAVRVAADGTFRCEGLPAGFHHLMVRGAAGLRRVLAKPSESWQFLPTVKVGPGEVVRTTLELAPASRLRGRVVDAAGEGVAGATVTAWVADEGMENVFRHRQPGEPASPYRTIVATCDARGDYELWVAPGRHHVTATAPGRSLDIRLGVEVGDVEAAPLRHRIVADGSLRGRTALDSIALRPRAGGPVQWLMTDAGGFALRGLEPGVVEAGTYDNGMFSRLASVEIAAGRTAWLDLCATGTSVVRGIAHVDGVPVVDVDVELMAHGPSARTASDGSFAIAASAATVAAGTQLRFRHRGLVFATTQTGASPRAEGHVRDIGVLELRARRIDVRAVGKDGAPVAAAFSISDRASDARAPVWSRADGRLEAQLIGRDESYLRTRFRDGSEVFQRLEETTVTVQHVPTGALAIRLLDRDGCPRIAGSVRVVPWGRSVPAPTDGATFWAQRDSKAAQSHAMTDIEGRALVRGLLPGPVLVYFAGDWDRFGYNARSVMRESPPPAEQVVRVAAGQETAVELVLR